MELKLTDIKNVLILGSGTLGLRIGLQSAISGFNTTIYDINEDAFVSAKKIQASILKNLIERNRITNEESTEIINRITFTTDALKAAIGADFARKKRLGRSDEED